MTNEGLKTMEEKPEKKRRKKGKDEKTSYIQVYGRVHFWHRGWYQPQFRIRLFYAGRGLGWAAVGGDLSEHE